MKSGYEIKTIGKSVLRALGILLLSAGIAVAADYYVRIDGNDANDGTADDTAHAWRSVQHAVDTVSNGDIIHVGPGYYYEYVDIFKAVVLLGANHDVAPAARTYPVGETIINSCGIYYRNGVIINGFTLYGATVFSDGVKISHNIFPSSAPWRQGAIGVYYAKDVTITDNEIHHCQTAIYMGVESRDVHITNNNIHDNAEAAIYVDANSRDVHITDNYIHDNTETGIEIHGAGVRITGNTLEGNARGIEAWSPMNATRNQILDHSDGAVIVHYSGLNKAEYNWWGHASGPTHANNPNGQGSAIADNGNPIDYSPWWADQYGQTTAGSDVAVPWVDFDSGSAADFFPQQRSPATWSVVDGKYVVISAGPTPCASIAPGPPDHPNRQYLERSIYANVRVADPNQVALIAFGYSGDKQGNQYFLCAGIYKGSWAIGHYATRHLPEFEELNFDLRRSYHYGYSHTSYLAPEVGREYSLRIDIEGSTARLFVDDFPAGKALPYLQHVFDSIPTEGGVGFIAADSAGKEIHFDDFLIRERVRTVGDFPKFPFVQDFGGNDLDALRGLSFTDPNDWSVENGELCMADESAWPMQMATHENLSGHNWLVECDVTLTSDKSYSAAGLIVGIRGLTGCAIAMIKKDACFIGDASPLVGHEYEYESKRTFDVNRKYHLTLRCQGGGLSLYINDETTPAVVFDDWDFLRIKPSVGDGYVGMGTYQAAARFDNFKVSPLPLTTDADTDGTAPELAGDVIINDLLAQYQNNPVRLYEYVHNEMFFDWSYESSKNGAAGALWRKYGSDLDQCSALIALLRRCNVPCRYVRGVVTMKAGDWTRVYGYPVRNSRGKTSNPDTPFAMHDSWWVQAKVGGEYIELFPWIKFHETLREGDLAVSDILRAPDIKHPNAIGAWRVDPDEIVGLEFLRRYFANDPDLFPTDAHGRLVYGSDLPSIILPNLLRKRLEDARSGQSYDQIGIRRRITPILADSLSDVRPAEILSAIPYTVASGPYTTVEPYLGVFWSDEEPTIYANLSDVPGWFSPGTAYEKTVQKASAGIYYHLSGDNQRHTIRVILKHPDGHEGLAQSFSSYDLVNKRLVLNFVPPSGVKLAQITGATASTPVLLLDGEQQNEWTGAKPTYLANNTHNKITVIFQEYDPYTAAMRDLTPQQPVTVGNIEALVLTLGNVSEQMFDYRMGKYSDAIAKRAGNDFPAEPSDADYEEVWGNLLWSIAMRYAHHHGEWRNELGNLFKSLFLPFEQGGRFYRQILRKDGVFFMGAVNLHGMLNRIAYEVIAPAEDRLPHETKRNMFAFEMADGSAYEHGVLYDAYGAKDIGSTMKLVREAVVRGGEFREITPDTLAQNKNFIDTAVASYGGPAPLGIYNDAETLFKAHPGGGRLWMPSTAVQIGEVWGLGWMLISYFGLTIDGDIDWGHAGDPGGGLIATRNIGVDNGGFASDLPTGVASLNEGVQDWIWGLWADAMNWTLDWPLLTDWEQLDEQPADTIVNVPPPEGVTYDKTTTALSGGPPSGPVTPAIGKEMPAPAGGVGRNNTGSGITIRDPVNAVTGEFYEDIEDLVLPGLQPLVIKRSYISSSWSHTDVGAAWRINHDYYLFVNNAVADLASGADLPDNAEVRLGENDGTVLIYSRTAGMTPNRLYVLDAAENPAASESNERLNNYNANGIGGRSNLKNNWVEYNPADRGFIVHSGSGLIRKFEWESFSDERPKGQAQPGDRGYRHRPYLKYEQTPDYNKVVYDYTDNGLPFYIRATDNSENTIFNWIKFEYDSNKRIRALVASDGRRVAYYYDNFGDLVRVARPDHTEERYEYGHYQDDAGFFVGSTHRITRVDKPEGRALVNAYDNQGRVVLQKSTVAGHVQPVANARFIYNADHTAVYDALGNKTVYRFDELKRLTDIEKYTKTGAIGPDLLMNRLPPSIGHWQFDGTLWQSAPLIDTGRAGKFDGLDDVVRVLDDDALHLGQHATVMAWIKADSFDAMDRIVGKTGASSDNEIFGLYCWNGVPGFFVSGGYAAQAAFPLAHGLWYHLAGTYDEPYIRFYVNGKLVATRYYPYATLDGNADFTMGNDNHGRFPFHGLIDDVALYSRVLTPTEIENVAKANRLTYDIAGNPVPNGTGEIPAGAAGHWRFDEQAWNGTQGEVIDGSGKGNNGTALNLANTTDPDVDRAGDFDGNDDYVRVSDNNSLDYLTRVTVVAWIKVDAFDQKDFIAGKYDYWDASKGDVGAKGYALCLKNGKPAFFVDADHPDRPWHNAIGTSALVTGRWYHLAGTYDYNDVKLYVDGKLVAITSDPTEDLFNDYDFTIGVDNDGAFAFSGSIDDVRVYGTAFTEREIKNVIAARQAGVNMPVEDTGLPPALAYWKCDEDFWDGAPGQVIDSSGKGNNGVAVNGANITALGIEKDPTFYGQQYFVRAPDQNALDPGQQVTVMVWIKADTYGELNFVAGKSAYWGAGNNYQGDDDYALHLKDGKPAFFVDKDLTGRNAVGPHALAPGRWYHLAGTYDYNEIKLYVDGELVAQTYQPGENLYNDYDFTIGADNEGEYTFSGRIDDARMLNRALTQVEIKNIMSAKDGGRTIEPIMNDLPPLVAHWKCDEAAWVGNLGEVGDASGSGNNATSAGGASTVAIDTGRAGTFSGLNQLVRAPDSDSLDPGEQVTVAAWIKAGSLDSQDFVAGKSAYSWPSSGDYGLQLKNGKPGFFVNGDHNAYAPSPVAPGQWYHLVGTYDGSEIRLYVNGELVAAVPHYEAVLDNALSFTIGADNEGEYAFNGLIDDIMVFDRALTQAEVPAITKTGGFAYSLYSVERRYWDSDQNQGNLLAKTLEDASGNVLQHWSAAYDDRGNMLSETLAGNLTGDFTDALNVAPNGLAQNGESAVTRYWYTHDSALRPNDPNDRLNLLAARLDPNGTVTRYDYDPNTGKLIAVFTCRPDATSDDPYDNPIYSRAFNEYDAHGVLIKTILDDGASALKSDAAGVTERVLTEFTPGQSWPTYGLPETIAAKQLDPATGSDVLLNRQNMSYDNRGNPTGTRTFDSNNSFLFETSGEFDAMNRLIRAVDRLGNTTRYTYDANGNVIKFDGPRADVPDVSETQYDFADRPIAVTRYDGQGNTLVTRSSYDSFGNKLSDTDVFGNVTAYSYDDLHRLAETVLPAVIDGDGNEINPTLTQGYDALDRPTFQQDANGNETHFTYNARGQRLSALYPDNTSEQWRYNPDGTLAKAVAVNGSYTLYQYDLLRRVTQTTVYSPDGTELASSSATYKPFNVETETDANGNITTHTYDGGGRLKITTGPTSASGNSKLEFGYDDLGRVTERKEWFGPGADDYTLAMYDLDSLGRLLVQRVGKPDGAGGFTEQTRIRHGYDAAGNRSATIRYPPAAGANGALTTNEYDALNNILSVADALDNRALTAYDYSGTGLKTTVTDALGNKTITIRDALNRIAKIEKRNASDALLHATEFRYDANGNQTRTIETVFAPGRPSRNITTAWEYNSRNQVAKLIEAMGSQEQRLTQYFYNEFAQISSRRNPNRVDLLHYYDARGRLLELFSVDGSIHYEYAYDANNNLLSVTDRINGKTTVREYDAYNRITREVQASGIEVQYSHDRAGRRKRILLPEGRAVDYEYNGVFLHAVGRMTANSLADPGVMQYQHTYNTRDLNGSVLQSTLGTGAAQTFSYDLLGRVMSIATLQWTQTVNAENGYDPVGNLHDYQLAAPGAVLSFFHTYNDLYHLASESGVETHAYSYDSLGNRISLDSGAFTYEYNDLNELTLAKADANVVVGSVKVPVSGITGPTLNGEPVVSVTIALDGGAPLSASLNAEATAWEYDDGQSQEKGVAIPADGASHTITVVASTGSGASNTKTVSVVYDPKATTSYIYDRNGNLLQKTIHGNTLVTTAYKYDALDRLVSVEKDSGGNPVSKVAFTYDPFNRRMSKTVSAPSVSSVVEFYLYDNQNEIGAADAQGHITHLRLLGEGLGAEIGAAVAVEKLQSDGTTWLTYTPIHDHRGNVVMMLGQSDGSVAEYYRYTAFGDERILGSAGQEIAESAIANPWRFASKRMDPETGLVYFGRRYYDPTTGRWLTKDPSGYIDGPNLYLYCSDNPVNFVDPFGLCEETDGERELRLEQERMDRFGYLAWLWDSLPVHLLGESSGRMDYGYRAVYDGLPSSYTLGGRQFESTMENNQFSNYMIGRMAYYSGGELGYLGAQLGGHLGSLVDFHRLDDSGSIEMLELGRQDAIQQERDRIGPYPRSPEIGMMTGGRSSF